MSNTRRIVERRNLERDRSFDEQFWPVAISLTVLAGIAVGAIITLLRGPWMWATLLLLPIGVAVVLISLWFIDNRRLKRSIQLALILSCAAHLLALMAASVLQIFGTPAPDQNVAAVRPTERTVTIRNRTVPFVWQRSQQKDTPEVEIQSPRTSTSESNQPAEVSVENARPTVQPQSQPRRESQVTVPRRDREMAMLKRSDRMARPQIENISADAPTSASSRSSQNPRSRQPTLDSAASSQRAADESASHAEFEPAEPVEPAARPTPTRTSPARRAERSAPAERAIALDNSRDAAARIRRSEPRIPKESPDIEAAPLVSQSASDATPTVMRETAVEVARVNESREIDSSATSVEAPARPSSAPSSRRALHEQPSTLSREDSQSTRPRRATVAATRPTSPAAVESPAQPTAADSPALRPSARPLAVDRATEGTAGAGTSSNLETGQGGPTSPAARPSVSAARRSTSRQNETAQSLTNQQSSLAGRRTPRNEKPQTTIPADPVPIARRAGRRQPDLESAAAGASRVDTSSQSRMDDTAAEQGTGAIESGPTKIVAETIASRRGGGGEPVPQLSEDQTPSSGGRSRSTQAPTLDADIAAATAAPAEAASRPAAKTVPGPADAASSIDRARAEASPSMADTDNLPNAATASTDSSNTPAATRRTSRSDQPNRIPTESGVVSADDRSDTATAGSPEHQFARAPTIAPQTLEGRGGDAAANGGSERSLELADGSIELNRAAEMERAGPDRPIAIDDGAPHSDDRRDSLSRTRRTSESSSAMDGMVTDADASATSRARRGDRRRDPPAPKGVAGLSPSAMERDADAGQSDTPTPTSSDVADQISQRRSSDTGSDDDGARLLDVDADSGRPGLADRPTMRAGIPDRPASEQSDLLALDSPTRFRRDTSAAPTVAPATAIAREGFRSRDPLAVAQGEPTTEAAIHAGLEFLARHQRDDGSWSLVPFDRDEPLHVYQIDSDTAATGLALLAFQGAGYNHQEFKYADRMQRAIDWLIQHQSPDGCLYVPSDPTSNQSALMYSHAIATLALTEAYGMTRDPTLEQPVKRALDYIAKTQDPRRGGWRYFADPKNRSTDTSVTGWMMMAIKSGQIAGIPVPERTEQGIEKWMTMAQDVDAPFRYRYNPFARNGSGIARDQARIASNSMTAVGLLMRVYSGWDRTDIRFQQGAESLLKQLPDDANSRVRDTYYWYYATQVLKHAGGNSWQRWNEALHPLLVESQISSGPLAGSWDPYHPVPDRWGPHGGRLYVTTLNLLSLEVQYRLLPLYESTVRPSADE